MAHNITGANSLRGRGRWLSTDSHSNLRPTGQRNSQRSKRSIPTHFLAVPLNDNPFVLSQISLFQDGLLKTPRGPAEVSEIRGLDPSIVIDPRRFHLTLGVMMLEDNKPTSKDGARSDCNREPDEAEETKIMQAPSHLSMFSAEEEDTQSWRPFPNARDPLRAQSSCRPRTTTSTTVNVSSSTFLNSTSATLASSAPPTAPQLESQSLATSPPALPTTSPRTVQSALDLLRSLKPQLDAILSVPVPSPAVDIQMRSDIDASVEHHTPGCNREAPMTGAAATAMQQNSRRKSVLRVKLDKLDIMQTVGLPKAKVKSNRKSKQTVEEISTSSPSNSKTLSALSSTDVVKEENIGDLATFSSITSSFAQQDELTPYTDQNTQRNLPGSEDGAEDVWANVMYLAPREEGEEGRNMRQVCDLIHITFKRAGYLTDLRPLKLHCTVLNTSKRKPAKLRGSPFCYSDVLASSALKLLGDTSVMDSKDGEEDKGKAHEHEYEDAVKITDMVTASKSNSAASTKTHTTCNMKPTPVPVNLGPCAIVDVEEIGLWIMGSRGPNNEYISCGGVNLG